MHPLRPRLADFLAAELRAAMATGRWRHWLPQERALARELMVSRSTLRAALAQLQDEGALVVERGRGHRIAEASGRRAAANRTPHSVSLLTPEGLLDLRPTATAWIDQLRGELAARGWKLTIVKSSAVAAARPARKLERLVQQYPASCWILRRTNRVTQEWFASAGLRCVIAGTVHAGIAFPFVDIDHRAVIRHAVGRAFAAAHRRLALLLPISQRAGDLIMEQGFTEGLALARNTARPMIFRHADSAIDVARCVRRALAAAQPPTVFVVSHATSYLAAFSALAQARLRVPDDVSLICCSHDNSMDNLLPPPTCYRASPLVYGDRILRAILSEVGESKAEGELAHFIFPEFIKGASLSRLK